MNPIDSVQTIKSQGGNSHAMFNNKKLTQLVLNKVVVISEEENITDYLLSGNYLCFPWVGRLTSDEKLKEITKQLEFHYPHKEQNNLPIHGFFAEASRKIFNRSQKGDSITFTAEYPKSEMWPDFYEQYTIYDDYLELKTSFQNVNENRVQYFAYGYHPYIGINRKNINNLYLNSNIRFHCPLNSQVVPDVNEDKTLKMTNMQVNNEDDLLNRKIGDLSLDDLFYYKSEASIENPFVQLIDKENKISIIVESDRKSSIPITYFQLYTPDRRNCVAIEPMSSPSNAFNIDFPNYLIELKPKELKQGTFKIKMKSFKD